MGGEMCWLRLRQSADTIIIIKTLDPHLTMAL